MTIDTIGTQKSIAHTVIDYSADDVLALTENQGQLHADVTATFAEAEARQFERVSHPDAKTVNWAHGRVDVRECWAIELHDYLEALRTADNWFELHSLVMVRGGRRLGEQVSVMRRYFIKSCAGPAERQLAVIGCR